MADRIVPIRGHGVEVDAQAAAEMAEVEVCWCCGWPLYLADAKLIRAKIVDCAWVVKSVCWVCEHDVWIRPYTIVEVDGEFWTLRPMVMPRVGR